MLLHNMRAKRAEMLEERLQLFLRSFVLRFSLHNPK